MTKRRHPRSKEQRRSTTTKGTAMKVRQDRTGYWQMTSEEPEALHFIADVMRDAYESTKDEGAREIFEAIERGADFGGVA